MSGHHKAVFAGDLILQEFDLVVAELHDGAAAGADEVVVVLFFAGLVQRMAVSKPMGRRQPAFGEEFHGSVYRGQADLGVEGANALQKVFDAQMLAGLKEDFGDELSLARELQPVLGHIVLQDLAGVCFQVALS